MNKILGFVVLGTMVGCGVDELEVGQTQSALAKCPDPEECTVGNGAGTYVEENGFAGIGPNAFMITRFINQGTYVSIEGRYHRPGTGFWSVSTGTVISAGYNGHSFNVKSVSETGTVPTWTFANGYPVIGGDIVNMTLVVELNDENNDVKQYTLMFDSYNPTPPVRLVNVRWKVTGTPNAPTQYCFRGPPGPPQPEWSPNLTSPPPGADPDVVAFQQDIAVNAINANILDRDMSYVTMSCSYGAMATVRAWGYFYKDGSSTQDFFDAALHMKRASYCGDDAYYTYNGTEIYIGDHASPVVNSDSGWSMSTIEALWSPHGAVCVNENHRRHYNAVYPGFGKFTNYCGLPNCTWYCNQNPQPSYCNVDWLSSRPVIDPNP